MFGLRNLQGARRTCLIRTRGLAPGAASTGSDCSMGTTREAPAGTGAPTAEYTQASYELPAWNETGAVSTTVEPTGAVTSYLQYNANFSRPTCCLRGVSTAVLRRQDPHRWRYRPRGQPPVCPAPSRRAPQRPPRRRRRRHPRTAHSRPALPGQSLQTSEGVEKEKVSEGSMKSL